MIVESPEEDCSSPATITEVNEGEMHSDIGGYEERQPLQPLLDSATSALIESMYALMPTDEPDSKMQLSPDMEIPNLGGDVAGANAVDKNVSPSHTNEGTIPSASVSTAIVGSEEAEGDNEADICVKHSSSERYDVDLLAVTAGSTAGPSSHSYSHSYSHPPLKPINIARSRRAQSTPSPSYSPLISAQELGVYLSASPSFRNALRTQTRPDSLAIDPHLPLDRRQSAVASASASGDHVQGSGNTDTEDTPVIEPNEEQSETGEFPREVQVEEEPMVVVEDDSSSLPPLSTPAELDPVFSLSPSRSRSASASSTTSNSRSESPDSESRYLDDCVHDGTRPPSLGSTQGEMPGYRRHVSESSFDSSLGDELSLTLYETSAYDSFDAIATSDEGPLAPRASRLSDLSAELHKAFSFERMVGWKPFDEKDAAGFEPGSSAGTLRPVRHGQAISDGDELEVWLGHTTGTTAKLDISKSDAMNHARGYAAGGYSSGRGGGVPPRVGANQYRGYSQGADQDSSESDYGEERRSGRWNGGRDGDGGDGPGDHRGSAFSTPASSADASDDDSSSDENTQKASLPVLDQRRNGRKGVYVPQSESQRTSKADDSEDDDVPLAQRHPNALEAQKSIRRQRRDERQRKRAERAAATASQTSNVAVEGGERGRTLTLRQPLSPTCAFPGTMSSSQEAALLAQRSLPPAPAEGTTRSRARARTLGSSSGVAPDDLAQRLLKVQQQEVSRGDVSTLPSSPLAGRVPSLRTDFEDTVRMHHNTLNRSATSATSHYQRHGEFEPSHARRTRTPAPTSREPAPTLRSMRSFHGMTSPVATSAVPPLPVPVRSPMESHAPQSYFSRPTSSRGRNSNDAAAMLEQDRTRQARSARPSFDAGRPPRSQRVSTDEGIVPPPVPPLPQVSVPQASKTPHGSPPSGANLRLSHPSNTSQMRIFIGDLQRFKMVEVSPDTTAKDILIMIEKQGEIRRESGWMVFEICQDFGLGK